MARRGAARRRPQSVLIGSRRRSRRSNTASSVTPASASSAQRDVVAVAEVLGDVRVARQRDRAARRRGTSPGTRGRDRARRPACAGPRSRPRSRSSTRRSRPSRARSSGAGRRRAAAAAAPVLDEVRVGEDVEQPGARELAEPREVRAPDLVDAHRPCPRCRSPRGRARRRRRSGSSRRRSPTRAPRRKLGDAVLAPGDEVGLDAEPQVGLLAHELAVGVDVVERELAPQRVVPDLERLAEAVDVLADARARRCRARSPRRGRSRRSPGVKYCSGVVSGPSGRRWTW